MSLHASSEDRIYLRTRWRISRGRFFALLALCLLVHALVVAFLLYEYQPLPAEPEVIPVELVPEPEPQPEPEKEEEQKPEEKPPEPPPQQQERSEIATDAPKMQERESPAQQEQEVTRVPEQAQQEPAPPPPEATEQVEPEPAPEALQPAQKEPPPKPDKTPSERFGTFTPLPDMEFEKGGAKTLMSGNARATYESILFGLIVPRIELPRSQGALKGQTQVNFTVDSFGRIVFASVTRSSGDPKIDAAVVAGLRKAAPFPPPPGGLPLTLFLTYGRK